MNMRVDSMFGWLILIFGGGTLIARGNYHCGEAEESGKKESEMIHDEKDVYGMLCLAGID